MNSDAGDLSAFKWQGRGRRACGGGRHHKLIDTVENKMEGKNPGTMDESHEHEAQGPEDSADTKTTERAPGPDTQERQGGGGG